MGKTPDEEGRVPSSEDEIRTASYGDAGVGPGGSIGPYKLLRILGEGGNGIVYLAKQPVREALTNRTAARPSSAVTGWISREKWGAGALTVCQVPA